MKIQFEGAQYDLDFSRYAKNGRTALVLNDVGDGDTALVATVNVPQAHLKENQVLIKDYSENHGVLAALETAGVVRRTGESVRSGMVEIPVCDLLVTPPGQEKGLEQPAPTPADSRSRMDAPVRPVKAERQSDSRDKEIER
jgi:hypothetical protein